MPIVGSSRYDGLKPATPQYAAGRIIEPPVWLPIAIGSMPAATAGSRARGRAAGRMREIVRIAGGGRLQRGEFGGDGLAEHDAASAAHQSTTAVASALGRCPA